MNRHRQTYFELNPEPREPSPWMILAGAAFALLTLWVVTVLFFSL